VGVGQVIHSIQQTAEELADISNAADRNATKINAVIAALSTNQPLTSPFSPDSMVGDRNLQRRLHRFRAKIGEESVVYVTLQHYRQSIRKFKHTRMTHLESRRIIERQMLIAAFGYKLSQERISAVGGGVAGE